MNNKRRTGAHAINVEKANRRDENEHLNIQTNTKKLVNQFKKSRHPTERLNMQAHK